MIRRPPSYTRTYTLFPCSTLLRSALYLDFRAVGLLHRAQAHLRIHIQDQADDAEEAEAAGDACRRHDRALSEGRAGTLTTALRTVSEGQSRMRRTVAVVVEGIVGVCTAMTLQEEGYSVTLMVPEPIGGQTAYGIT